MFNLTVNDKVINVRFEYPGSPTKAVVRALSESKRKAERRLLNFLPPSRITICRLSLCDIAKKGKERYAPLSEGSAKCNIDSDFFDKTEGRKRALENAVRNSDLNEKERSTLWNVYHGIVNQPDRVKTK
jgi:hypothetical protein